MVPTTAPDPLDPATAAAPLDGVAPPTPDEPGFEELLEQLRHDRLWLLRQIDSGRWPQWRLDLAALERELGQLLDQAAECGEDS